MFGGSLDGISKFIEFDDIIDIDVSIQTRHVYNLHTENNYYFASNIISYNGIGLLSHNCRCTTRAEFKGFEPTVRRAKGEGIINYKTYDEWYKDRVSK
jgi:hypothetical protein